MIDENDAREGCIKGKPPLSKLSAKYRLAYIAIALIHHFGALKYGYYNWYNDPANCNSTVSDNIDAIFRHLTAHRIGKYIDSESHLPHIYHACCRAGMLITVYYRQWGTNSLIPNVCKKNENANFDVLTQLTTEEILVLSKDSLVPEYTDINDLSDHIFEVLCSIDMFDRGHTPNIELDNTCYDSIEDLVLSVWRYTIMSINEGLVSYDINKVDNKLQEFLTRYHYLLPKENSDSPTYSQG